MDPVAAPLPRWPLAPSALIGFLTAAFAVIIIAFFTYQSMQSTATTAARVTQSNEVVHQLQALISTLKDAETGQRGYLLTSEDSYLTPFHEARAALPSEFKITSDLTADNPEQQRRLSLLQELVAQKVAELQETIDLNRAGDSRRALTMVRTDLGKEVMDHIRSIIGEMQESEHALLLNRQAEWQRSRRLTSTITNAGSGLLLFLILIGALVVSRDYRARETQAWLKSGQMELGARIQGEQRIERLGEQVLEFLARYLQAPVGALYVAETAAGLRRVAGYATAPGTQSEIIQRGDTLLGQVARENRALHVRDVPQGYLPVTSSLGHGKARELLLAPAAADGVVHAVLELGFFRKVLPADTELLARVSEALGVAIRTSKDRTRLEELLQETQRQSEELQTQQEELRVNNEELEVQTRALKESQLRLESQQVELEQTNSQLEEQAQLLEQQKSDLTEAQGVLTQKAAELERVNQYKSEFLANMSHELRTPLNSTLILAKLLADNKAGNLTDEQVKFAQTISAAGKELLALINDILDLAKIEAGKIEIEPESIDVQRTAAGLRETFEPVAADKGLAFEVSIHPQAPAAIHSDSHRLGQILRNLLSNAIKFTERGKVSLEISGGGAAISFVVRDTGIGIPEQQQSIIFEAFRQADGSTHRKYGGSGLGLSISRDLAHMLGGEVAVQSTPNQGSAFTLTIPTTYVAGAEPLVGASAASGSAPHASVQMSGTPVRSWSRPTAAAVIAPIGIEDDRNTLVPANRLILIVEDDPPFAAILRDLAHEMGFQCVITHTAADALTAAKTYRPNAVVLDVNLPDHSGLGVLDALKHDPLTRHVPVHVVSVADFSQEALELGAVGYALKPVKRDELAAALRRLEAKFSQSLRRLLIVEDDRRQRESIQQLLANGDIEIVAAETATEAFAQLERTTFDCMVMDLSLPDFSGYELLERMAAHEEVAFPPVIIYTGRALSREDEQKLRRLSRSIIIKDARSPERLLDEVTLFLHQVEANLPLERQRMLKAARAREALLDGRRILIVEDDARNIFALSALLEPKGCRIEISRNGREALDTLERVMKRPESAIDLVLMDIMMPEMDGLTAMREIRKRTEWTKLPIIALTAKARKDDQEKCLAAGANDYIAKPLDVEKLLSLVRVWIRR